MSTSARGRGAFNLPDARILAPGHPERSLILFRMAKIGLGRMPHVATSVVDENGVRMIHDRIKALPTGDGKKGD